MASVPRFGGQLPELGIFWYYNGRVIAKCLLFGSCDIFEVKIQQESPSIDSKMVVSLFLLPLFSNSQKTLQEMVNN